MSKSVHKAKPAYSTDVKEYKNYRSYKPTLRFDFHERCGYCNDADRWVGGPKTFHIDHFAPKKFEHLTAHYENLVYSCPFCNIPKSDYWASDDPKIPVVGDEGMVHPCDEDYDNHLERGSGGRIHWKTPLGKFVHSRLNLGLRRHEIDWLIWRTLDTLKKIDEKIDEIDSDSSHKTELLMKHRELANKFLKYHEELVEL